MYEWSKHIQTLIDTIDACIKNHSDEALTLSELAREGYTVA